MYEPVAAPEKKLHMVETAYEKWSHHEVFLLFAFFFKQHTVLCKSLEPPPISLYFVWKMGNK